MSANDKTLISVTDLPAYKDEFEITPYINGLANFIKSCETPLTIAIQGEWGSGKTSIMNMVKNQLNNTTGLKYKAVWFNTWQYAQFDSVSRLNVMFITDLIEQLFEDKDKSSTQNLKNAKPVEAMSKVMKVITNSYIDKVADEKIGLKDFTETVKNSMKGASAQDGQWDYQKYLHTESQAMRDFKKTFGAYVEYCCKQYGYDRIVFFIDDLDRIAPYRAVELMEIMKNFLDCEYCIFILAIDYVVVVRGVKDKFGETQESKARSFFEKIIQLPFMVPVNYYNVEHYVENLLNGLGLSIQDSKIHKNLFELMKLCTANNPRAIKRLLNVYALNRMVNGAVKNSETQNLRDVLLLGILGIQLSYSKLYDFILTNHQFLTMMVKGKSMCLMAYLSSPAYLNEEMDETDVIELCRPQTKEGESLRPDGDTSPLTNEFYLLKEQLKRSGISEEWMELCEILSSFTILLKNRDDDAISPETLQIFQDILKLSKISSYEIPKNTLSKKNLSIEYEIYGESLHAESAKEMYLYVMERILEENASQLDKESLSDMYSQVDCFYDYSCLPASEVNLDDIKELEQYIMKNASARTLPTNTPGQAVTKFRRGKVLEIGNMTAFLGASLDLKQMVNYINNLARYFKESSIFKYKIL